MTHSFRPRRSCLFMPTNNARAVAKARTLSADMIVLDLEDAVAPEAKTAARKAAVEELARGGFGPREILVRINGLDTQWGPDDLRAVVSAGEHCNGIIAPKVSSVDDILALDGLLSTAGAADDFALWVMIETPLAILNLAEIAAQIAETRLAGLIAGTNDLAKDMRAGLVDNRMAVTPALSQMVMAARSYDLAVLDGVYNDFRDEAGLCAEAEQGRMLGFDGKTLIHPAQIAAANAAFAPQADALAQAQAIVAAFADPANAGQGAIAVGGAMVERLHLAEAERLLAVQAAIALLEQDQHANDGR